MRVPIVCVDERIRQFAHAFAGCFTRPQYRHFVTVLAALLLCAGSRTLTGLLRAVGAERSLASLSRFLGEAPWSAQDLSRIWQQRFRAQVQPLVTTLHQQQRAARPKRRGRPKASIVTGYLIGDDSTLHKKRGKKMEGVGMHYSTTERRTIRGHSLVQCLYVVAGRRCPLQPLLYRQQKVCTQEGVRFRSKVELMEAQIRRFQPQAQTHTHVLLDSWYSAKTIWKAARDRGFSISTGLRSNRAVRVRDAEAKHGWRWQALSTYAAGLTDNDYVPLIWPKQGEEPRTVYVHEVQTVVRNLYRCRLLVVRDSLKDGADIRFWATSDFKSDLATLIAHLAVRWDIEVLFADTKELLGLDQYQVMSAQAIMRFWTLVLTAYVFLEEERARLRQLRGIHVTIGEAQREVQRLHWAHLIAWMHTQFHHGQTPAQLFSQLAA